MAAKLEQKLEPNCIFLSSLFPLYTFVITLTLDYNHLQLCSTHFLLYFLQVIARDHFQKNQKTKNKTCYGSLFCLMCLTVHGALGRESILRLIDGQKGQRWGKKLEKEAVLATRCSLAPLSNTTATSHVWLLST